MTRLRAGLASAALVLACGALPIALVHAQDGPGKHGAPSLEPAQQAEKLLQSYKSFRQRSGEYDRTRKEIEEQIKELGELVRMRYEMTLTLAELKAQASGQKAGQSHAQPSVGGSSSDDSLGRELKNVQAQLAGEIEQAHAQTEKVASQLQAVREGRPAGQAQAPARQQGNASGPQTAKNGQSQAQSNKNSGTGFEQP